MSSLRPIKIQKHILLTTLSIHRYNIRIPTLTMESDKFIVVREKVGENAQFVIIDMSDVNNPLRLPITVTADSAIMNPATKVLALRTSSRTLRIFDIEMNAETKACSMLEDIVFCKWVNANTIAFVTKRAVYHWSLQGDSAPVEMFEIHSTLSGFDIIDYRTDAECKWLLLILRKFWDVSPFSLLAASRLHVIEVGSPPAGNQPFQERQGDVYYPNEALTDFPVAVQASSKHGIIYLLTDTGYVYLYDIETAAFIYMSQISDRPIIVTTEYTATEGIIGVNSRGQVLSVSVDEQNMIPYVRQTNPDLALKLAVRCGLPGAEELSTFTMKNSPEVDEKDKNGNGNDVSAENSAIDGEIPGDLAMKLALRCDLLGAKDLFVRKLDLLLGNGNYAEAAKVAATLGMHNLSTFIMKNPPKMNEKEKNGNVNGGSAE